MVSRLLSIFLVALVVAGPAAGDTIRGRKERVDSRIQTLNERIAATRVKEQRLAGEIEGLTARIRALEAQVGDVSRDLSVLEQNLALQREKLARITELWKLQTAKLAFLRDQHDESVDRLSERLVAIYQSGELTTVDVLLASASFGEMISRLDYARDLSDQDRRIADSVGRAKNEMRVAQARTTVTRKQVAAVERAVAVRTQQAREVRNELLARESSLSASRSEQRETLVSVQKSREEYLHEVEALARVSAQLASRIQVSQTTSAPVQPSGGGLIWPVPGPVTSPFGWRWGRMHEGIDIGAPSGTPIRAASSGRVIYAAWMSGYGNLVVVDHGGGLATAYAHASAIYVGVGQDVAQGQAIAAVGCTGHCFGSHLHFEVRVNGAPVDPLGYLG